MSTNINTSDGFVESLVRLVGRPNNWNNIGRRGRKRPQIHYLYFVQAANGLIKIGYTGYIEKRLDTLRFASPIPLMLIGVLYGDEAKILLLERKLHIKFNYLRSHGEWFRPDPVLLGIIAQYGGNLPIISLD